MVGGKVGVHNHNLGLVYGDTGSTDPVVGAAHGTLEDAVVRSAASNARVVNLLSSSWCILQGIIDKDE